jgi:PAS domain-containing protein
MQQQPHRDEDLLRRILDTAHEAFIMIDADGVILEFNREAERTFWGASWRRRSSRTATGALTERACAGTPTPASERSSDSASR